MLAYRLVKERWAAAALDGTGARAFGGRWNSPGTAMLYASQSIALAALELLVHLRRDLVLGSYRLFTLEIPDSSVLRIADSDLPTDWRGTADAVARPPSAPCAYPSTDSTQLNSHHEQQTLRLETRLPGRAARDAGGRTRLQGGRY